MTEFLRRPEGNTPEEQQDKADILELINFERYCRDNALWDEMRKCFTEDSTVSISWYEGSGDGFVTASSKMGTYAPHKIHNTLTWINSDRAVTVMMATIQMRRVIDGVECELSSDAQLHFSTVKKEGKWYICRFESIYEQDRLMPILPDATLSMDSIWLSKYRKSYACMSYMMEKNGFGANQELPGIDRPDLVKAMRDRLSAWLDGE